jgi:putative ABC transport system ATP-binding protein
VTDGKTFCDGAAKPSVDARGLVKVYLLGREEVHALRGIDFRVDPGDFTVINGPSGSGKTTLLNLIALIDRPTQGEVLIDGEPTSALSEGALADLRRRKIGLIFQTFNLIPVLSAYENVEYPLLIQRVGRAERRERVQSLLEGVGLTDLTRRRPDELSGGQRQRVAIARALVSKPQLVLADEPTANLDSETAAQVMAMMRHLNEERCVAFVVVTHDPAVTQYARRAVRIHDGRLAEGGSRVAPPPPA